MVNVATGNTTLVGVAAARWMVVDNTNTAYVVTLSGLSVIPLTLTGVTQPQIAAARPVINTSDGSTVLRPGSFVTINGAGLADTATANVLPAPTVLGGSCVTFNDVTLPLFQTSSGQIQAQIPANVVMGSNVVVVRSLATGQASNSVVVTVTPATTN